MAINPKDLQHTAQLTFAEEFNQLHIWNGTQGLDVTANIQAPLAASNPGTRGYANNNEQQWYVNPGYQSANGGDPLPNPFSVSDGVLTIEAKVADAAIRPLIDGQAYTSGVLSTYHAFSQTYGYFEMRAELPAGQGLWPAFWLMPADGNWPPEIDVMEMLGHDPSTLYTSVHSKVAGTSVVGPGHLQTTDGHAVANMSKGFHTYGVDWNASRITWYFDAQPVFEADTPADANTPMYMIANLAVGGNWPGQPDNSTPFPAHMKIDYLRVYVEGAAALPSPSPAPAPEPAPTVNLSDTLTLRVAQDVYGADAAFVVRVDGTAVGETQYAHADHRTGVWDTITLHGEFHAVRTVDIAYVNDANSGLGQDRNLYVDSISLDGRSLQGNAAHLDNGIGQHEGGVAALWSNGHATFTFEALAPAADATVLPTATTLVTPPPIATPASTPEPAPEAALTPTSVPASNPAAALAAMPVDDPSAWREGRNPAVHFDRDLYLTENPDVKAAGMDPLLHYLQFGEAEGRQAHTFPGGAADLAKHPGFDAEYYLLTNADVALAALVTGGDTFDFAYQHYESYGWHEGRDPNAMFDIKGYLAAYKDVAAAGLDPLTHYDQFGWHEGRDPSAGFDTKAYEAAYADVTGAGLNPIAHFLQWGASEGRVPFGDGHFG